MNIAGLTTTLYRTIRLWDLTTSSSLVSWVATKTYISALYMNDTMVVSGSGAGIVKLWDLPRLLDMPVTTITMMTNIIRLACNIYFIINFQDGSIIAPLRKINMKGVLHYPIKEIYQCTYTDLVIIAKYASPLFRHFYFHCSGMRGRRRKTK